MTQDNGNLYLERNDQPALQLIFTPDAQTLQHRVVAKVGMPENCGIVIACWEHSLSLASTDAISLLATNQLEGHSGAPSDNVNLHGYQNTEL